MVVQAEHTGRAEMWKQRGAAVFSEVLKPGVWQKLGIKKF